MFLLMLIALTAVAVKFHPAQGSKSRLPVQSQCFIDKVVCFR